MRTILVTSDVTYVPKNYYDVLEFVVSNTQKHIVGVIFIKMNLLRISNSAFFLYLSGCTNMAHTLVGNLRSTVLGKKKMLLNKYHIPFIQAKSINDPAIISWIQGKKPDLMLNMRTRCIYKDAVLKIPRLGCVNVHHGILPEQKGLFCDVYALANNRKTGFTIHKMTKRIDDGQILYQEEVQEDKQYIQYLAGVSAKERIAIAHIINQTAANDSLSRGRINTGRKSILTTTPDFKTIKQLQRKGIVL